MATTSARTDSARDRLLDAANELFYAEGVHTVGIDRIIDRAGVAKASLYATFGSKDGLIRAYLDRRHEISRQRLEDELPAYATARDRLIGVFEIQGRTFTAEGFRGCPFVRASAESGADSIARTASDEHRAWTRSLLRDLCVRAGAADPDGLARQLSMLYDGAVLGAWMDHDPQAAQTATRMATILVDRALAAA